MSDGRRPMPEPLDMIVDALATYRLTRLITGDSITQGLRDKVGQADWERLRDPDFDPVAYKARWGEDIATSGFRTTLVNCPWCASVWVAGGVVLARALAPVPWRLAARGLAMAAVGAWIQSRE